MQRSPGHPTAADVKAAVMEQIDVLAGELRGVGVEESVHNARRRIKRLRSLSRLVRESIGDRAFAAVNDPLREAAAALAGRRRAEALVHAASLLNGKGKTGTIAWTSLAEAHRADQMTDESRAGRPEEALALIEKAKAAARKWNVSGAEEDAVIEALTAGYARARRALKRAFASDGAEDLHEARKQVIHHLHHLAFLAPHLRRLPPKRLDALERLREALGDLNDLVELEALAHSSSAELDSTARRPVKRRHKTLLKRAKQESAPLFRLTRKAYAKRIGAMWKQRQA